MLSFLKDRLSWLWSLIQSRPVWTRKGVVVQFPDPPSETSFTAIRKPGLAHYVPREGMEFILEGTTRMGDRVVYQLYHTETKKTIRLSEETFKLLFKLK